MSSSFQCSLCSKEFSRKSTYDAHMKRKRPCSTDKKEKGQFYTTNSAYILDEMPLPPPATRRIVEPFAGKGDLIDWLTERGNTIPIDAFDIEPKCEGSIVCDTLESPPDYDDAWVITNPPYLARNKSTNKAIFDKYETNDLYKCFIMTLCQSKCIGGIIIIPAGFFFSPRDIDVRCRSLFMSQFRLLKVRYFEQTVFDDTTTTVAAIAFERTNDELHYQDVEWTMMPSNSKRIFHMDSKYDWIIGGDVYSIGKNVNNITVRRHVEGMELGKYEQQTHITLNALDSGKMGGRIGLSYKEGYVYPAKDCSRTYATMRVSGVKLSSEQQIEVCRRFNELIEKKREETCSLFLPQFRESKEYARKRIPFELAYGIIRHIIAEMSL
jgi:hypothetical protein